MKHFIICLFACSALLVKSQSLKITVTEKNLEPLANTKFGITISDTIMLELTTGSDGLLGKIPLDPGTYKIRLFNKDFVPAEAGNIIISGNKVTSLSMTCARISSLSAEEKKKLGLK